MITHYTDYSMLYPFAKKVFSLPNIEKNSFFNNIPNLKIGDVRLPKTKYTVQTFLGPEQSKYNRLTLIGILTLPNEKTPIIYQDSIKKKLTGSNTVLSFKQNLVTLAEIHSHPESKVKMKLETRLDQYFKKLNSLIFNISPNEKILNQYVINFSEINFKQYFKDIKKSLKKSKEKTIKIFEYY